MRFWKLLSRRTPRPRFVSPLARAKKTVVLEPLFRQSADVSYIDPAEEQAATSIRIERPAILAGRLDSLLNLAPALGPNALTHAVVVLTETGQPCLSEAHRDDLWDKFGVPAFEQVIDAKGRLAAWECEAHSGLHLASGAQPPAGSLLETALCDCGGASPRILGASLAPRLITGDDAPRLLIPGRLGSSTRPIPT
jgi:hypothetical protein